MRGVVVAAALALALVLQTLLTGLVIRGAAALDLVLIVVVYVALTRGPVTGLVAGTVAGLAQDALGSGVLGIGGLAKTIVGFAVGVVGTQFIVSAPLSRLVVFAMATVLHAALFMGLYVGLGLRSFPSPFEAVATQAVGNAFVGVVGFQIIEWLPGLAERRRARRPLKR
ncbi:MAG: rod shape-determining protein MreD [Vicinamibacterales bacterium]|nr:rod shape-determining protein MreD [Vicinamibacterales bacterium]